MDIVQHGNLLRMRSVCLVLAEAVSFSLHFQSRHEGFKNQVPSTIKSLILKNAIHEPQRREGAKKSGRWRIERGHPKGEKAIPSAIVATIFFLCEILAPLRFATEVFRLVGMRERRSVARPASSRLTACGATLAVGEIRKPDYSTRRV
ncbi:MAG: hypothetical protein KGZ83_19880 [Sulfuricella sp.]|nr:hypothetical protein [Sulfuricella sp.]